MHTELVSLLQDGDYLALRRIAQKCLSRLQPDLQRLSPQALSSNDSRESAMAMRDVLVETSAILGFAQQYAERVDTEADLRYIASGQGHAKDILAALRAHPLITHQQLATIVELSDSNLSNHMKRLITGGLVSRTAEGKHCHYEATSYGLQVLDHASKQAA
jgi:DNA-binding transcriptional ArsR family regulator